MASVYIHSSANVNHLYQFSDKTCKIITYIVIWFWWLKCYFSLGISLTQNPQHLRLTSICSHSIKLSYLLSYINLVLNSVSHELKRSFIIKYKKVKRVILYFQIIRQDHSSISAQDWQIVEFVFVKLFLAMKIRIVWPANIIWPIVAETTVVLLNIITLGENFHVTPMCHVDSSVLGPIVVIRMVKSSRTL